MVSIPRSERRALYRSGVGRVPCRPPFLLGVVPSQRLAERRECTSRSASSGLGRGVFASPRLGPKRLQGRPRTVFCLGRHSQYPPRFISPPAKIPAARARGRRLRPLGLVASSERLWATQRPRSGGLRAPWAAGGRADRSSSPAGSRLSAMGGAAAPGACAAWAGSCAPLGGGLRRTRGPSTTAQHDRPAPPVRRVAFPTHRRR